MGRSGVDDGRHRQCLPRREPDLASHHAVEQAKGHDGRDQGKRDQQPSAQIRYVGPVAVAA